MKLPNPIFRINAWSDSTVGMAARPRSGGAVRSDDALARLSKLIPAEIVGAYLTGRQIAEVNGAVGIWSIVCLLLVVFVRGILTRDPAGKNIFDGSQWDAVLYSAISFVIWVYAMGDNVAGLQLGPYGFWASLLAIVFPIFSSQLVILNRK